MILVIDSADSIFLGHELVQGDDEVFLDERDILDLSAYEVTDLGDGVFQVGEKT